jgi:replicative DNA helicase
MSERPSSNVMHERSVITYLVHRPDSLYTYADVLQGVRYDYPPAQAIFSLIIEAWNRYRQIPTHEEMASLVNRAAVGRNWPDVVTQQVLEEVDLVYTGDATDVSGEFIAHFVVAKEAERLAEDLSRSAPDRLLRDIPAHIDKLEELQLLGARESELGIFPFSEPVLNNMEAYIEELYGGDPMPFGIGRLDERMRGGLRPGEMGIIAASTGTGKSLTLLNVGLHLTHSLGKRVIYYAFDNTQAEMLERMYAITSRRSISEPDEGNVRRQHIYANIGSPHERFLLKDYPPNSITTTDLLRHVKKVKNMLRVRDMRAGIQEDKAGRLDYVIVDYGDLIRAGRSFKEYRLELKDVFEELTSLAKRENVPVLTATQGNRESLSKETVTLKELAESFAKAWPASFVATLCQTQAERKMGQMRMAVVKARRPECNYVVPLLVDYKTMRLADNEDAEVRGIEDASPSGFTGSSVPRTSGSRVSDDAISGFRKKTKKVHSDKG